MEDGEFAIVNPDEIYSYLNSKKGEKVNPEMIKYRFGNPYSDDLVFAKESEEVRGRTMVYPSCISGERLDRRADTYTVLSFDRRDVLFFVVTLLDGKVQRSFEFAQ